MDLESLALPPELLAQTQTRGLMLKVEEMWGSLTQTIRREGYVICYVLVAEVFIMVSVYGLLRCIFGRDRRKRKGKRSPSVWADETRPVIVHVLEGHADCVESVAYDGDLLVSSCLAGVVKVRHTAYCYLSCPLLSWLGFSMPARRLCDLPSFPSSWLGSVCPARLPC